MSLCIVIYDIAEHILLQYLKKKCYLAIHPSHHEESFINKTRVLNNNSEILLK